MRQALGRGLEALLPKRPAENRAGSSEEGGISKKIPIKSIRPNRLQPRKNFDPESLSGLAQTIKEHGLAQPILVSSEGEGKYELIAGERRLRATELAGFSSIDAVVMDRTLDDKQRLTLALIENIQRDDLNSIEEAHSYKALIDKHGISQTQLSQFLGKSRSAISNTLRLLDLSDDVQKALQFGQITEGHARALLGVANPIERDKLFKKAMEGGLSVREVENLARVIEAGNTLQAATGLERRKKTKAADIRAVEQQLTQSLGMKVEIRSKSDGKRGAIIVHFYNLSDFDKLLGKLK